MKAQSLLLSGIAAIALSFSLVACNKSSNVSTPGALSANCVNGYCYNSNGSPTNIGFFAQTSNFSYLSNYSPTGISSSLNIQSGWRSMLKEAMGVCDRDQSSGGYYGCNDWMNGMHDLVILMDSSTASSVRVQVRSYPTSSSGYSYGYTLPSASDFFLGLLGMPVMGNPSGFFDPMILTATIWPTNNSQGFEIRATGPQQSYGWNKYLQLQVTSGKVEDASFQYQLYWNGTVAATGTMVRCQTQTCGL